MSEMWSEYPLLPQMMNIQLQMNLKESNSNLLCICMHMYTYVWYNATVHLERKQLAHLQHGELVGVQWLFVGPIHQLEAHTGDSFVWPVAKYDND